MFPMFYERWNQISRIRLYASADGIVWNEVPGGAVINPGTPGRVGLGVHRCRHRPGPVG